MPGPNIHPQRQAAGLCKGLRLAAQLVHQDHKVHILLGQRRVVRQHGRVGKIRYRAKHTVVALAKDAGAGFVPCGKGRMHVCQSGAQLCSHSGQCLRQEQHLLLFFFHAIPPFNDSVSFGPENIRTAKALYCCVTVNITNSTGKGKNNIGKC